MTYPLLLIPPTPSFLGTSLLGLGLLRLFAPKQAYPLFGLPLRLSTSPSPFIFANAGRDIALGVTYILLGLQGNFEGVRAVLVGTCVCIYFLYLLMKYTLCNCPAGQSVYLILYFKLIGCGF